MDFKKMLIDYSKPALTINQQLELLKKRGMVFDDLSKATKHLETINYYRLSGYWHIFRIIDTSGKVASQFRPNTNFDDIVELYYFDKSLRKILLDGIEHIEVAIRTRFAYQIGHTYGTFGHEKAGNFHESFDHDVWLEKLKDEIKRSDDGFINHYKNKYTGFPVIPVWMVTEVISLGALSKGYKGLRNAFSQGVEDKKKIADYFNLHHKQLGDWLHTLTYVRNVCAHHSRIWNRKLAIRGSIKQDKIFNSIKDLKNDRIFYVILMIGELLKFTPRREMWIEDIKSLLNTIQDNINYKRSMGLPGDWIQHL